MRLARCPVCLSQATIVASEQMGDTVRHLYCQCQNLNCGTRFKGELTFMEYIGEPCKNPSPPNPQLQPDLVKDPRQQDLLLPPPEENDHEDVKTA